MLVKLTAAQEEQLAEIAALAKNHKVSIVETYKEAGMNLMVRWVEDSHPDIVMVLNITRFSDMIQTRERQVQLKEYLARGGTVKHFDDDVGHGLAKSKYVARKNSSGGRKAEPIQTGDAKFDMYLNALPEPVRVLVVPLKWDPRALYKEYRTLKKDGMIAKYATPENQALAQAGA